MNVIEPILFQCRLNPTGLAVCVPGSGYFGVTYGMLQRFILSTASMAENAGVRPGNLVAIYISGDTILHLSLILGLTYLGAATLSLRGPTVVPGIKPDLIMTDVPGQIPGGVTVLGVDQSWLSAAQACPPLRGGGTDLCRIILTSGSTGVSKGIAFSHQALAARIAHYAYSKGPRFARCSRLFCGLGISTSPGFRYALVMLSRGGTIYFLGPEPADILQTILLHKIEGMATSPFGLGEFLKFYEAESAFDVTFDHIICQGAKLSPGLAQRVRARMSQNLYCSYGSTETTTVAFGPASLLEKTPGAVGYVQPGVTVECVDRSGNVLPPLQDGEIRIRTDHMVAGYVGDLETTQRLFRDGYFYSGDSGYLTPDGLLVITGRQKTALNVGGETINPERVEEVIAQYPGVREAGVFAQDNDLGITELHALIVLDGPIDTSAILGHCARRLALSCVPVSLTRVDKLPRGEQGKVARHLFPLMADKTTRVK